MNSKIIEFWVQGEPVTQGSLYGFEDGAQTRLRNVNTPALRKWRKRVASVARRAMAGRRMFAAHVPLLVGCEFSLPYPSQGQRGGSMKLWWPTLTFDEDKLVRAVRDALTGVVYHDDAQVIGSSLCDEHGVVTVALPAFKHWALPGVKPGVMVRILELPREQNTLSHIAHPWRGPR